MTHWELKNIDGYIRTHENRQPYDIITIEIALSPIYLSVSRQINHGYAELPKNWIAT